MRQASAERAASAAFAARLRERREEIEHATLTRVLALTESPPDSSPEYAAGLRTAVREAIRYGIEGVEHGASALPPIPAQLLAQARLAAASGVGLDTVLRRYVAGHALLGDFIVEEAECSDGLPPAELKRLLRRLAATADRLLAAVSAAYAEAAEHRQRGSQHQRAERIERLLAGEPMDTGELDYNLEDWHLGLVASGPKVEEAPSSIARTLDARVLVLVREAGTIWAWLARREPIEPEDVLHLFEMTVSPQMTLAIGEPGEGPTGWRLTHRQARAAFPIAQSGPQPLVRYADVALLASILQDDLLATSLQRLYLEPLETGPDEGAALRETLRVYFACERKVSSAAAALRVDRHTVTKRLNIVERHLGQPLRECGVELQAALRLDEANMHY